MIPLLLALCAPAHAADSLAYPTKWYRLWSWTAVEGVPNHLAESQLRAQEQVAAEIAPTRTLSFYGVGSVGKSAAGDGADTGELQRLLLVWRRPDVVLEVGRLARWDVRGREHIDGFNATISRTGPLTFDVWGGQLWHPETWDTGAWMDDGTLVGGAEVTVAPVAGFHALAGAEARYAGEDPIVRGHAAMSAWGARGERALAVVEVQPDEGFRATVDGDMPVRRRVDVEVGARWEGLEPATLPIAIDSPQAWLGGEGYGTGTIGVRYKDGPVYARVIGGPNIHPELEEGKGGNGRLELGYRTTSGWELGLTGVGAGMGSSWIAGGAVGGGGGTDRFEVHADAGLFRYMPLSGGLSQIAEGRLRGEYPIVDSGTLRNTHRLVLVGELAAGTDRVLERWLRGGVALHGTLAGPPPKAPPAKTWEKGS